ncbi:MAG: hypothetical protein Q4G70_04480 [Pseudomonadota bacterium]|nr:hypothetical protein [Pseudomonadota bacterium]
MRRFTALVTALALTAGLSLPAQAEPGEALNRALEVGALEGDALESLLPRVLAGIDVDALIHVFEQSAQAAAEGRTPDPAQMDEARQQVERQMEQTAPMLAREAASALGPVLRELRAELARELASTGRD